MNFPKTPRNGPIRGITGRCEEMENPLQDKAERYPRIRATRRRADFKTGALSHSATPAFEEGHFFATGSACHSLMPPSRPSVLLTTLTLDGSLKLIVAALPPPR
jgi:hypothetical protein